jgi:hypothetical protein
MVVSEVPPEDDALAALTRAFVGLWTEPGAPERERLTREWSAELRSSGTLSGLLRAASEAFEQKQGRSAPPRFVLVIDQGEEIYTRNSARDVQMFTRLIARSQSIAGSCPFRSDQYGELQRSSEFSVRPRLSMCCRWVRRR